MSIAYTWWPAVSIMQVLLLYAIARAHGRKIRQLVDKATLVERYIEALPDFQILWSLRLRWADPQHQPGNRTNVRLCERSNQGQKLHGALFAGKSR